MTTYTVPTSGCPFHPATDAAAAPAASLGARVGIFSYGLFAYALFLIAFLYAIGFVGGWVVPKDINDGLAATPTWLAVLIDAGLLGLFAVQHAVMARPRFKRWITRFIPKAMERSTFVIAASAILLLTFWQWRPLTDVVWRVGHPGGRLALDALSLLGWGIVLASSFLINHFDLFGLRQVWLALTRRPERPVSFRVVGLYRLVRHPLMLGFLIAFWSTPTMTTGHLLFALLTTGYILVGTWMEERDLIAQHADAYRAYRRRVPGLLPIPKRDVV